MPVHIALMSSAYGSASSVLSDRDMKKRTDAKAKKLSNTRRLKVKKEILRNLSTDDLAQVAGGVGCRPTVKPPGSDGCYKW